MDIDDMYNDNYTEKCNTTPSNYSENYILRRSMVGYTKGMNTLIVPNTSDSSENLIFLVSRGGNV
jgi:hypothetical protein